jgi:hypothetical protein
MALGSYHISRKSYNLMDLTLKSKFNTNEPGNKETHAGSEIKTLLLENLKKGDCIFVESR